MALFIDGEWREISQIVRESKRLFLESRISIILSDEEKMLEDRLVQDVYLTPNEGESYQDYKSRFEKINGKRSTISRLLLGESVGIHLDLRNDVTRSALYVHLSVMEGSVDVDITSEGRYETRAEKLLKVLQAYTQNSFNPDSLVVRR